MTAILAPSWAARKAIAFPIPRELPVIKRTLFLRELIQLSSL
ncbi:hypothetical protein DSAG12_04030 [Promethearchaeum syntrophicum]|uniref:Uncharacterized protein n=1 Tax=Promethearchaeum syntrophicum TaxID=2594042 RepID=A0AC61ZTW0_9ARCH|nr:hypothetical protein [Candidatus Prometheoarchaeum syntrophicum]